jgi:hypothetical protein
MENFSKFIKKIQENREKTENVLRKEITRLLEDVKANQKNIEVVKDEIHRLRVSKNHLSLELKEIYQKILKETKEG